MTFEEDKAACLKEERLFEDSLFPAGPNSINPTQPQESPHITWKRPPEFCEQPKFTADGLTRFDLDQGALGNCWFVAAAATVATRPQLMSRVVPAGQSFSDNYAGIFHFYFWRYGEWKEVIIDDRLPVKYGKQLVFCRNKDQPDEFWGALLEKAYAKLNGSYEALHGGRIQDALVDFTGGVSEVIDLNDSSYNKDVFASLQLWQNRNSLMGCSISTLGKGGSEPAGSGLLTGHAYSITDLKRISVGDRKIRMIRLLNPWGKAEWTGPWSDSSSEWNSVSEQTKKELEFRNLEDGEFWMSFDEWKKTFTELQLCHLTSGSSRETSAKMVQWREKAEHGAWVKGVSAGGCGVQPNEKLYWNNPQYCVVLKPADNSDPSSPSSSLLVVSLMQKINTRPEMNAANYTIGYRLFRITRNEPMTINNTIYPKETITLEKGLYNPLREVSFHYENITPGVYCIIPSTYRPGEEGQFFLRVLTQQEAELRLVSDQPQLNDASGKRSAMGSFQMMRSAQIGTMMTYGSPDQPVHEPVSRMVSKPLLEAVRTPTLGRSAPRYAPLSAPDDVDSNATSCRLYDTMTPSEREVVEVYETYVSDDARDVDADVLLKILFSLNKIGQLGCYKIHFSREMARILFNLASSPAGRHLTLDQVKSVVKLLKQWTKEFAVRDRDYVEFLSFSELWEAFDSLGFGLDVKTKQVIVVSYCGSRSGLDISDFVTCAAKISAIYSYWSRRKEEEASHMSLQKLLQRVLAT